MDRKVLLVHKDHRVPMALLVRPVQPVLLVRQVRKEQQVIREVLVRLGLQAHKGTQVQQDPQALQALRVLRERQVQQDLQVLQETRERLDRLVR